MRITLHLNKKVEQNAGIYFDKAKKFVELQQGNQKTSSVAKKIRAKIGGELDDIIRAMPAGGCKIK